LLMFKPIIVNGAMEVVDGQHRLAAARELGVAIYYQVNNDLRAEDVILMNTAKAWVITDYLNYYVKNHYPEYIKLNDFFKSSSIPLRALLSLSAGNSRESLTAFKEGKFLFDLEASRDDIEYCNLTIAYIRKINGTSRYLESSKFWNCILKLVRHPYFEFSKWKVNLERMISKIGPRI